MGLSLCLTLDGKREDLNVDFVLSIESLEAKKYKWKTKNIHLKSRKTLIRGKSRLDPFLLQVPIISLVFALYCP